MSFPLDNLNIESYCIITSNSQILVKSKIFIHHQYGKANIWKFSFEQAISMVHKHNVLSWYRSFKILEDKNVSLNLSGSSSLGIGIDVELS